MILIIQLPPPPPPPEELRESRRNLAAAAAAAAALEKPLPPPQQYKDNHDPDQLANRLDQITLNHQMGLTDQRRSLSAGRLNHYGIVRQETVASTTGSRPKPKHPNLSGSHNDSKLYRQMSFPRAASSSTSSSPYVFGDVAAGVLIGGVLTQWNAGPDCWDWGMGWGWTSWNAAFCGTCAIEQAALANHISQHQLPPPSSMLVNGSDESTSAANFYFDDDNELGELGEATDVGCDFGDFGF